jgi:endonuclease YncB( thermonuclease family)
VGAERLTRTAVALAALALGAAGCTSGDPKPQPAAIHREAGVVARVGDGDTLTLDDGRTVRLVQIDAPELTSDCYGRAAQRALSTLAGPGTRVRLVRDPRLDASDRYGRPLRYVVVAGRNVNVELVRRGAASPYFFRNERGTYARELLAAVERARSRRAGYWGACPEAELNTGLGSITGRA